MSEFDVIVIGGGPVGENVADYATRGSGLTAAIVEAELLGGECSYWACMPSKALLRPIDVAAAAAHLGGISTPVLDPGALLARRDAWVANYRDAGQVAWAEGAGISLVRGHGSVTGEREVTVTGSDGATTILTARKAVVIATGSTARIPENLTAIAPWTSRDATGVKTIPAALTIVGGGVVAVEAARWMNALGSKVTMLVRGSRLLPGVEAFAADLVTSGLRATGIDIRFGVSVVAADRAIVDPGPTVGTPHGGKVTLTLSSGPMLPTMAHVTNEVLVAVGREPATAGIGLEHVSESLAALPDWLHLVGDAAVGADPGAAPLTHWGKYQARLLGAELAGNPIPAAPGYVPVPQVVFTDPQIAAVGPTADAARTAGHRVRVIDSPYTAAAGAALLRDDARGQARLVVDAETETLLGATFVGPDVDGLVHSATIAIVGRVPFAVLRHAVPSYPTPSEIWLRLLEQAG